MCGNLSKCHDEGEYFFEVEEAMSLEPTAIIGKTIQDEAKFRNVVVGRKGAVNRILKRYLSSQDKGAGILNNTPGGYGDVSKVRNLPRDPKVFEWVNHKNNFGHGVGSTMASNVQRMAEELKSTSLCKPLCVAILKFPKEVCLKRMKIQILRREPSVHIVTGLLSQWPSYMESGQPWIY